MTVQTHIQSAVEANLTRLLNEWRRRQSVPSRISLRDYAGVHMPNFHGRTAEMEIADTLAESLATPTEAMVLIDGAPVLAVEIEFPFRTYGNIRDKINESIAAGLKQVWVVDPEFHTVRVHRPEQQMEFFTNEEIVVAEPELPGFRMRVAQLFECHVAGDNPSTE